MMTLTKIGQNSHRGRELNDVSIAVIGCAGVGKSTFMQRALDLKSFPRSRITSKKVSLEGSISVVRLIELDVTELSVIDNALRWPKIVGGYSVLRIDGLLLLYDILDHGTFDALPPILGNNPPPRFPDLRLSLRTLTQRSMIEEDNKTDKHLKLQMPLQIAWCRLSLLPQNAIRHPNSGASRKA